MEKKLKSDSDCFSKLPDSTFWISLIAFPVGYTSSYVVIVFYIDLIHGVHENWSS